MTYASAAHCALVEVDPTTGQVTILRYLVVHDCGRVVNPMLADGQVVGGVVQGIGGALYEHLVYDESGQPLSGSFMDYAMPLAAYVPSVELDHIESRVELATRWGSRASARAALSGRQRRSPMPWRTRYAASGWWCAVGRSRRHGCAH